MKPTHALIQELMNLAATDMQAARKRLLAATPVQLMQVAMSLTSSQSELEVATLLLIMVAPDKLNKMNGLADLIVPATEIQIANASERLAQQEQHVADSLAAALEAQRIGSHEAPGRSEYYYKQIAVREIRKGVRDHFLRLNTKATRINTLLKAEVARRASL